jgi:hypothetical protein
MGLESFGEKIEKVFFEKEFGELSEKEKMTKEKIKAIFQENAELNGLLLSEDLNFSNQQRIDCADQLKKIREETRDALQGLRSATGHEVPESLSGVRAAGGYYSEMNKEAA